MLLANLDGSIGGAQRQARLLASAMARRGRRVAVVNQSPGFLVCRRAISDDRVEHVALPIVPWLPRSSFLCAFLLWAIMNRRWFAVIHAHSSSAGLTAGLVGRLLGKAVVVKITGMRSVAALASGRLSSVGRRWLLNATANAVVAVSSEMMQGLAGTAVRRERCVQIPNGVRLETDSVPAGAAGESPLPGSDVGPRVLYVGRLTEVKGVRRLVAMWSEMPRRDAATLVIVGDGPLRGELERESAARRLGASIEFVGTQGDVMPFYLAAAVFVLPSCSEGLSNALLEAMAAGLPVVASDVEGNREVVEHGVNGFLVDWTDASACGRLVGRLLDDSTLRRRIGDAARRRALCFSIETVAEQYGALYRTLVAPSMVLSEVAR